jgi:hypothetical protein
MPNKLIHAGTPKWEDIVLIHAVAASNGNHDAMAELQRMARLADIANDMLSQASAQFKGGDRHATFNKQTIAAHIEAANSKR